MIYQYPKLESIDRDVLALIRKDRQLLRFNVNGNPVRWNGFLRRNTFARALRGSNTIEGFNANLADAVAIIDDQKPETVAEETLRALEGYRTAMTYIIRLHSDPHLEINAQFIRSLHFMIQSYDMTKLPGQWRQGPIYVVHEPTDETVYEAPEALLVPGLMDELVAQLNSADEVDSSTVLGAMAHLNLTMIHPFKDGNGRMARALQTLIIARNGAVSPEFSSIEEWLGKNTDAYYKILADVGNGRWSPENSALPWVRFCLIAHYQQANTLLKRNAVIGRVLTELDKLRAEHGFPERYLAALLDATFGYKVRNQRYREENDISDVVASRDLKEMTNAKFLSAIGEKRGRYYVAAKALLEIQEKSKDTARAPNPYDLAAKKIDADQLKLNLTPLR
ncbi:MAG: Fic family protein [Pseudomonadota bacterium]